MKLFENISSGYKRIATGIAIVGFLAMMYLALIPGASIAYIYGPDGGVLSGAFVFIKEWPQYNDTTEIDGIYAIDNVPYGDYTLVAAGNDSYAPNISSISVSQDTVERDIQLKSAIKYYVPFLYNGGSYRSDIQIQNNGTIVDDVEIPFYSLTGTLAGNNFYSTQPNKLMNKNVTEIRGDNAIFVGPAKIKSNYPVMVQGTILTVREGVYSIAPSFTDAVTKTYIPFLYQITTPNTYDAGILVYNPGNITTNVNIKMYSLAGVEMANIIYPVGPKATLAKYVFDIVTGVNAFVGPAVITSEQPVVAQGYIRTRSKMIYSIAPSINDAVLEAYIPFLYQITTPNTYDAGIIAFNPGNTNANVTIKMYSLAGVEMANNTYSVAPNASVAKYVFDMVTGVNAFVGPAKITSDQPIVAQGYIRTRENNLMAYSIAPQVRKPGFIGDVHIPFLYQTTIGSHDAGIIAINSNDVAADIKIDLYYPNGTKAGNVSQVVAPNAGLAKYVFDIAPYTQNFDGYAIISANQSIVAQGYIRKSDTKIYSITPPVER